MQAAASNGDMMTATLNSSSTSQPPKLCSASYNNNMNTNTRGTAFVHPPRVHNEACGNHVMSLQQPASIARDVLPNLMKRMAMVNSLMQLEMEADAECLPSTDYCADEDIGKHEISSHHMNIFETPASLSSMQNVNDTPPPSLSTCQVTGAASGTSPIQPSCDAASRRLSAQHSTPTEHLLRMQCDTLAKRNAALSDRVSELVDLVRQLQTDKEANSLGDTKKRVAFVEVSSEPNGDAVEDATSSSTGVGITEKDAAIMEIFASVSRRQLEQEAMILCLMTENSYLEGRQRVMEDERGALMKLWRKWSRRAPVSGFDPAAPKHRNNTNDPTATFAQSAPARQTVRLRRDPVEMCMSEWESVRQQTK